MGQVTQLLQLCFKGHLVLQVIFKPAYSATILELAVILAPVCYLDDLLGVRWMMRTTYSLQVSLQLFHHSFFSSAVPHYDYLH